MRGHAGGSHLGALGRITPYLSSGMNPAIWFFMIFSFWNGIKCRKIHILRILK
jgi:hypothetical protein